MAGRAGDQRRSSAAFIDELPGLCRQGCSRSCPIRAGPGSPRFSAARCPTSGKSVGGLVTQGLGFVTTFLTSLWSGGRAVFSVLSLLVITPVVAFYLLRRLGPRGGDGRQLDAAASSRHGARACSRHRRRHRRLRARAGGDLPDPCGVLRRRPDARPGSISGFLIGLMTGAVQLHSVCRRDRRISRRRHRRGRAVLAGLVADRDGGRACSCSARGSKATCCRPTSSAPRSACIRSG